MQRPAARVWALPLVGLLLMLVGLMTGCSGGGSSPTGDAGAQPSASAASPTLSLPPNPVPSTSPGPISSPNSSPAPSPTPTAWEQPLSASSLPALQLNVAADSNRSWVFADILRTREAWILPPTLPEPAAADALATAQGVEEDGSPTGLPAGAHMEIHAACAVGLQHNPETGRQEEANLHGVFVLTWQGRGTVDLRASINDGRGCRTLLRESNRTVFVMDTPFKYPVVHVLASDPADPVRRLRLWAPTHDGAGLDLTESSDLAPGHIVGSLEPAPGQPEPLFHPMFLGHLAELPDAGVLRFLGWLNINGVQDATPVEWRDRMGEEYMAQSLSVIDRSWGRHAVPGFRNRLGYPIEWMIALCNQTGRDLWIQLPHTATPDLVQGTADLIARRLRPDLRVWVEYSNELWNSASPYLPQRTQAAERAAQHFNLPPASLTFEQIGWGAGRLQADFLGTFEAVWRARGQSDARLVNVAAGFTGSPSYNRAVIESMREVDVRCPEVLAITNYFAHSVQFEIFSQHDFGIAPGAWPASLVEAAARIVRRDLYSQADGWTRNADLSREFGLPLVSYEGGQHVLAMGLGDNANPAHVDFMRFLEYLERTVEMGAIYREHYALFSACGGRMASVFMDVGTWSFWGYWGAKEYVTQTRATSTKWDAICGWGEAQRGVRDGLEPAGSRPALPDLALRGEVDVAVSTSVAATGGDGAVDVTLLAGTLPPGVTLQGQWSGRALLAGTPTSPGSYDLLLRARDADGDVSDRHYVFIVDPAGLSDHALVVFRGADLPASPPVPNNGADGRYDPQRATETLDGGARLCVPFSWDEPLFGQEFLGANVLSPSSPLNIYGGWSLGAQDGPTREGAPQLSSWTGLRGQQFTSWTGDLAGPSLFEAVLLWRATQFAPLGGSGAYRFGANDLTSTLQADLTSLVGDGTNEVRFVVVDRVGGADAWYLSEASSTSSYVGDGIFRLQGFNGSSAAGKRWAAFTPPSGTDVHVPVSGLVYGPHTFNDVRAVGLCYRGTRWRWHFAFGFNRFFALGERR